MRPSNGIASKSSSRRRDVDAAHEVCHAAPTQRIVRRPDQQRNAKHRVVDEESVRALAVIAETLAVIADGDDHGSIQQAARVEKASDPADLRVDERDLAEVRPAGESVSVRFGRVVRRVRIVKVNPTEEAGRSNGLEPRQRVIRDVISRPLHLAQRRRVVLRQIEIIKVGIEALRDSPRSIEHVRADESTGRESAIAQPLGERRLAVGEKESAVVAHAVGRRKLAGEDRRMRRQRERRRRDRLLEEDPFARKPIEIRRRDAIEAVRVDAIGARRIQRHEQQVEFRGAHARRQTPEWLAANRGHRMRRKAPPCDATGQQDEHGDDDPRRPLA
jgi:hypothetical protein